MINLCTYVLLIAAIACELFLIPYFLIYQATTHDMLVLHGIACLLGAFGIYMLRRLGLHKNAVPIYLNGLVFTIFFPVIGLFASCFYILAGTRLRTHLSVGIYDTYEELVSRQNSDTNTLDKGDISFQNIREEVDFLSFIDILHSSNTMLKIRLIQKLSMNISHKHVTMLKETLRDTSQEVRLYVHTALIKMDTFMNKKIEDAQKVVEQLGYSHDWIRLADHYYTYAHSGLVGDRLKKYYIKLASEAYQHVSDITAYPAHVLVQYAHCLFELNDLDTTKLLLQLAEETWENNEDIPFFRSHVAFACYDIIAVPDYLQRISHRKRLSKEQEKVLQFWIDKH